MAGPIVLATPAPAKLEKLTVSDVTRWLRDRQRGDDSAGRKPLSMRSCQLLRGMLRAALNVAVADNTISKNPVTFTEPTKGERREVQLLSMAEAPALLDVVSGQQVANSFLLMLDGELLDWRGAGAQVGEP